MSSMITSAEPEAGLARRPGGRLVGRARERRLLDGLVESAEGGGAAVIIAGEAGVGKTALLMHVAGVARQRGLRVLEGRGEESEAALAFATLADLLRPSREKFAQLPRAQRQALEVCLALSTGRWASAHADATEALQRAEEISQPGLIGQALAQLSRIAAARGDRERCDEYMERARQEVEPYGVGGLAVHDAAALGLCALSRGDLTTAIDHLERAWDTAQAAGLGNPNVVPFAGDLAEALARAGAAGRAREVLAWLHERADATGLVHPQAAAARARGILARDPAEAEACFATAHAAHARQPMPFEQARTLLCQGEALRRSRRPAASRAPLRHALTIFTSLDARPWAARAMTELDATGARAGTPNTATASALNSLSPQELQVARAVGRGLNNVETAAALFVSRKTVEAHLTRAYRKLGIRSRTGLTRLLVTWDQTPVPA
jgi:DNA-binding NarL/FixJ family response regulator